ncbi:MAG: YceH family protein [Trichloromonas sp.]|jgi:uncharacterized protein YceH (UPF0502 family)|nr:YceH family protein [Trichloromonas sp.]
MTIQLNQDEVRVLGCFIEKEMTTPEYYPLTLNALTTACNQKSNRDPVVAFDETTVVRALDRLRHLGLAMQAGDGGRVPRYKHALSVKLYLEPEELAVLAELMLRGPQTLGELRARADRMHSLKNLEEVEVILKHLAERKEPLVMQLPRQPGRKECRYAHLLAGVPEIGDEPAAPAPEAATLRVRAENERLAALEGEVAELRVELESLKGLMDEFKAQFE